MGEIMSGEASTPKVAAFLVAPEDQGRDRHRAHRPGRHDARARRPHRGARAGRSTSSARAATARTPSTSRRCPRSSSPGPGITVVKHGNRAASSSSGSADVLEELGIRLDHPPARVAELATEVGITFCFAQVFHPSFRHTAAARTELGIGDRVQLPRPAHQPRAAALGGDRRRRRPDGPAHGRRARRAGRQRARLPRRGRARRDRARPARRASGRSATATSPSRVVDWAADLGVARIDARVAAWREGRLQRRRRTPAARRRAGAGARDRACSTPPPRSSPTGRCRDRRRHARRAAASPAASTRGESLRQRARRPTCWSGGGRRARWPSPAAAAAACAPASALATRAGQSSSPRANACSRSCWRVRAERDVGLGAQDALDLADLVGDHVGEVVVLAHADHGDEVDLAGDGVDLADARDVGDRGGDLRDPRGVRVDEHDGGQHARHHAVRGRRMPIGMTCASSSRASPVRAAAAARRAPRRVAATSGAREPVRGDRSRRPWPGRRRRCAERTG